MLIINDRFHSVNANVVTIHGKAEDAIHGWDPDTTPEALTENLRMRPQGVEIPHACMLRNT
ncbi:hypothetical protein HPB50_006056 [Hyalomma asiaticum]|uniref:Uncharacterized protein n=1 Tax=Hyalomma asiaticum TaxID=266040 RepID=A0ACB7SCL8_HYAAI|nr:hypothetical protein HPB50_006056 [Hyalomma asiaticum]